MAYRSVTANHVADPCLVLCLVRISLSGEQPIAWLQAVPVLMCNQLRGCKLFLFWCARMYITQRPVVLWPMLLVCCASALCFKPC